MFVDPEQTYISYGRGAIALYTLSEYIGEEDLNKALKKYLKKVKYQDPPYITSPELISFLKEATPENFKYLIKDMFKSADAEKTIQYFNSLNLK